MFPVRSFYILRDLYCYRPITFQIIDLVQPRQGHSTTAICLGPGVTEVTMFGGTPERTFEEWPKLADTAILQFSEWRS